MPMYNLTKYSDNYLKTSGILWNFKNFTENNATESMAQKKNVEIMVPLKYLGIFCKMSLFKREIKLDLNLSEKCVIAATDAANRDTRFQ